jgi:hypothetical protein
VIACGHLHVVLRLAGERSLEELAGILDDDAAASVRQAVEDRRERRSEAIGRPGNGRDEITGSGDRAVQQSLVDDAEYRSVQYIQ